MMKHGWLHGFSPRTRARARLFCFGHAGGSAAVFRKWADLLPADVEMLAVQLPGRGGRLSEPVVDSIPALVERLLPALEPHLDRPYALFGHSMGAVLASEVARRLDDGTGAGPRHLFVSGRRPAHVASGESLLHALSDAQFVVEINRRYGGIPHEVAQHRDLLELLLPSLRADIKALETFAPAPGRRALAYPLTAFGGATDPLVPRDHLDAWRDVTAGAFRVRVFDGGHFYLDAQARDLVADLGTTLVAALANSDPTGAASAAPISALAEPICAERT